MRGWLIVPAKDDSATIRSVAVRIVHWSRGQTATGTAMLQCPKISQNLEPETKVLNFLCSRSVGLTIWSQAGQQRGKPPRVLRQMAWATVATTHHASWT
jgi:hypothetical protein